VTLSAPIAAPSPASAAPPLRLTGTVVAQFFRFRCERQLRYELVPASERGGGVPRDNADAAAGPVVGHRAGMELLARAGRAWERRKLLHLRERLGPERVLAAGWDGSGEAKRLPVADVLLALRSPGAYRFLVQPELRLAHPAPFLARYGLDAARVDLAASRPDLIRLRVGRDGRPRLGIADIKWSREAGIPHFAQVAFYSLLLEEMCRAEGIDAVVERRRGWIWSRGSRGPRPFALAAYRHHVQEFLREDLARAASIAPADAGWHLEQRCAGCRFFAHCRAQADAGDDLARVPGITPLAKQVLRGRGVASVTSLGTALLRRDTFTGCHALEANETALKQRTQAIRWGKVFDVEGQTRLMGGAESVRALVSADADPVTGTVFALGLRVERPGGKAQEHVFLSPEGTPDGERAMLRGFLARALEVAVEAAAAGGAAPPLGRRRSGAAPGSLRFFVWDRAELENLRGLVTRHVGDPDVGSALARFADAVFPPSRRGINPGAPGTVLLDAVSELFALPVAYAYDLASVSDALRPAEDARPFAPPAEYAWPWSSQVAFERIHDVWRGRASTDAAPADRLRVEGPLVDGVGVDRGAEPQSLAAARQSRHRARDGRSSSNAAVEVERGIRATVAAKLAAMDSVVRAVRERAVRRGESRLAGDDGFVPAPGGDEPIAEPTLEKLRLFVQLEAAAEAIAIRALHALPARDRARRFEAIRGMEMVERRADGKLVFEFDAECREAKFRPGDFALVLTNEDTDGLVETDRKPWLRRRLMMELVDYDLAASPPRVLLAPSSGFDAALKDGQIHLDRVCVLDRASTDFNSARLVATLRRLAAGDGEAAAVLSLLQGEVPAGWPLPVSGGGARDLLDRASDHLGRPVLNREQERARRAVFERACSVIWGPPGTGKTYLLAWTLLSLAASARREGRPLRILVTSATHRAVVNVLVRMAREVEGADIAWPLRAVKLKGSGSEADADLDGTAVELIDDAKLPSLLQASEDSGEPIVVGGTVWSLWKQMRAANAAGGAGDDEEGEDSPVRPWFDVVVIDEASQVKVPDALVAMSSLRAGGRVVLCGDDRQLAPVVRGSYGGKGETLFGSAFTHFAARYRKLMLRESRRMNAALVEYPREQFYPGLFSVVSDQKLTVASAPPTNDPADALLWELFFRPEDAVVLCTYRGFRATARNPFEAALAARLAHLARVGLVDRRTGSAFSVEAFKAEGLAILSPHRAQNSAILGELAAGGWPRSELPVVDTVERMQGNEREMIVVSYAVADGEYAEREAEFLLNPNRFNVAVTRARSKLIVLMSEEVLRALPRDERVMADSMAVKGYPAHCADAVRDVELPGPGGAIVLVTIRTRRLGWRPSL
jgi:DNA replication ATP-dependent helicase Dna2